MITDPKRFGYDIANIVLSNLEGCEDIWRKTNFDTKEFIINETGRVAIKLATPPVSNQRDLLTDFAVFMGDNIERGKTPASLVDDFYESLTL